MPESWSTRRARWLFNWFPAYRGTGGRVEYIAADWTQVRVRVPLNWRTRNVVGTIFGGSLYGVLDPIYMLMLIRQLGPDFVVWDKAATIRFRRPGRSTLRATFTLPRDFVETIRREAIGSGKTERILEVTLANEAGDIAAECSKTLYVRWRGAGDTTAAGPG